MSEFLMMGFRIQFLHIHSQSRIRTHHVLPSTSTMDLASWTFRTTWADPLCKASIFWLIAPTPMQYSPLLKHAFQSKAAPLFFEDSFASDSFCFGAFLIGCFRLRSCFHQRFSNLIKVIYLHISILDSFT
jgi:hypothetical protein